MAMMKEDDDLNKCFWVVEYLHPLNLQVLIESYSERQKNDGKVGIEKRKHLPSPNISTFSPWPCNTSINVRAR